MHRVYPEVAAGGYSRIDGTVEFYGRVNALLRPDDIVVDFGAGRGSRALREPRAYRTQLSTLKGKCRSVIGIDIDPVVNENSSIDESRVVAPGNQLPVESESCGMIIADFVLEHIEVPELIASEISRVLRVGGWFCARTPNRWGYVATAARFIPSSLESRVLKLVQPDRDEIDVFPKFYRLNTFKDIRYYFSKPRFDTIIYAPVTEPAYVPRVPAIQRLALFLEYVSPELFRNNIFVFCQKMS